MNTLRAPLRPTLRAVLRAVRTVGWLILHPILWGFVGLYWGHAQGYGQGARAVVDLVLELHGNVEPPPPWKQGAI